MEKSDLEYYLTDGMESGCHVYCGTYAKYNNGSLKGAWIDLEKVDDADEFFEVCALIHDDEEDPEFMFQDFSGIPDAWCHESLDEDDVEAIIAWAQMDDNEKEMCEDYMDEVGSFDDVDDVRDRCRGQYDSFDDYAREAADEMISEYESMCKHDYSCKGAEGMVGWFSRYFDYDAFTRDLEIDGYVMGGHGYVFSPY